MAELLKGAPVAARITEETSRLAEELACAGVTPTLAVVRVGEREDDLSYERSIIKRAASSGVAVRLEALPGDVAGDVYFKI